jgi:hypothetical protein
MKKQIKKLVLAKETLRSLEGSGDLEKVAGGTLRDTVCQDCTSGFVTCNPTGLTDCRTMTYTC